MSEPVRVLGEVGDEVKIYVWDGGSGPILNLVKGVIGDKGFFEATFFSLNVDAWKLQIIVIDSRGKKIRDEKFLNMGLDDGILVDCLPSVCTVGVLVDEDSLVVASVSENVSEVEDAEEENMSVILEDAKNWDGVSEIYFTGKSVVVGEDGVNLKYSGGIALLFLLSVIFMMMHRRRASGVVLGEDEKELAYMEKKVKEVEGKIVKIKDGNEIKKKVAKAKAKLAEEETELKELERGGDEKKIEKQEEVVDKAEEKVADQENN